MCKGTIFVGHPVSKMNPTLFFPSLAETRGTELRIENGILGLRMFEFAVPFK